MIPDPDTTDHERGSMADDEATGRRWHPLLTVVLVLAVLVAVVCAGWTLRDVQRVHGEHRRDDDALAAGRSAAVAFTSYDYRRIGEDLDRISSRSTGKFRDRFTKALGVLTAEIKKAHGVSVGTVSQAGLVRGSDTSAVVIAAVDASITNRSEKGPSLRRYRLQITLTRVDYDWLISDIRGVA